ncbi:mitochondrial K+-H+ exchange-related-domain-containing protein [Morchella snyderi]|nr:mitochondrial K+-H+ exchange-related-domain-containing protein [Morchella snyderi]
MRLYLIPISTRRTLIYGQRLNKITHPHPSLADKASARAAKVWLSWENGKAGWQRSLTDAGNKLFNRIPYEEWGLKSIPPLSARRKQDEMDHQRVEVIYPPSIIKENRIPEIIKTLATERNDIHRSRLIWSIVGMPIVAPFALVPIIPNIPFFYLLYRAFSHWKALAGAKHLEFLVNNQLLQPTPTTELDSLYRNKLETEAEFKEKILHDFEEVMLINPRDAKEIAASIEVPALAVECERACAQVRESLRTRSDENFQLKEERKAGKEKNQ